MKIYDQYKKVVKKIGKLKKAYFTTFNLDVDFVESYIIPPLLSENKIKNDTNMRLKREDLNTNISDIEKIKFFYDASMLTLNYKQTVVSIYPVKQLKGVFHPKVIYLEGDKEIYLIVGSGNLSVNGWGRNIEAFEIIKLQKNSNLQNQVLNFFDEVLEKAGQKRARKTLRNVVDEEVNFVYSFNKTNATFLKNLNLKKTLNIYSPYFSNLDELFNNEEFKDLKTINIVPNLVENKKIAVKEPIKYKDKINYFLFNKDKFNEKNSDSINHSKVWITETRYAIGSYNCTKEALYGVNFEASIVKKYENIEENPFIQKIASDKLEFRVEDADVEDELDGKIRFSKVFKLVADYEEIKLTLRELKISNSEIEEFEPKDVYIVLPSSVEKKLSYKEFAKLTSLETLTIINALVKNKIFSIYDKNDKLIFRGLIDEVGVTDNNRFVSGANTLEELFLYTDKKNPTESQKLQNKTILSNINTILYKKEKKEPQYNYFNMFIYFKNLDIKFEKIKDDAKKLESFCVHSICSLQKVKQLLEKQKIEPNLFLYLSIEEFNLIAKKANQKYNHIDFYLNNIDLKLSKEDKRFIKEMMR